MGDFEKLKEQMEKMQREHLKYVEDQNDVMKRLMDIVEGDKKIQEILKEEANKYKSQIIKLEKERIKWNDDRCKMNKRMDMLKQQLDLEKKRNEECEKNNKKKYKELEREFESKSMECARLTIASDGQNAMIKSLTRKNANLLGKLNNFNKSNIKLRKQLTQLSQNNNNNNGQSQMEMYGNYIDLNNL